MDDKELLESAARASGVKNAILYNEDDGAGWYCKIGRGQYWRPLQDDGDAFRLAVKLNLLITIEDERCGAVSVAWGEDYSDYISEISESPDAAAAATRRAIVRAAAAIGEKIDAPAVLGKKG